MITSSPLSRLRKEDAWIRHYDEQSVYSVKLGILLLNGLTYEMALNRSRELKIFMEHGYFSKDKRFFMMSL